MIGAAFRATFRAILADRAVMMLLIVSAVIYSFFYPAAYSGEVVVRLPVAVVDMDHTASSRGFAVRIDAVQQAHVVERPASARDALALIQQRKVDAFIVIPQGFEDDILRGEQGQVALYGNGAYLLTSSTALTGIGSALSVIGRDAATAQAMMMGAPAPSPLTAIQRPLFNTREGYGSTVVPGVTFLIIQQTMLMGLAMMAATMREKRGEHQFTPSALLGTALAFCAISGSVLLYYVGFVFWFQDYPRAGASGLTLLVAGGLFVAAVVAASLALASVFHTRERPVQLLLVMALPMFFLSNLSWPAEQTPQWLRLFAMLLPTTPGIHLMIGTNQMGASITQQWGSIANLLGLVCLYGAIAWYRLTRRA